jgi:hypothetical protein
MTMAKLLIKIKLYVLEIPATFVLVPVGLFMEFIVTLPFMIICELDGFFQKKARNRYPL